MEQEVESKGKYTIESYNAAIQKAKDAGLEVIVGDEWHMLLDFDNTDVLPERYHVGIQILNNNGFYCHEEAIWRSKSGLGFHVVVKLETPIDIYRRLALQAALGSDPKRELLAVMRASNGVAEPSVLFKPADAEKGGDA